ncbi:MAG: head GIN domain-containing protein [Cyclobacteriaceae bacterium]
MLLTAVSLSSCYIDDPGPVQETERQYPITDFDRLEMGDAFNSNVEQGNFFDVSVRGDRRNIDDLSVRKEGSTLIIRYTQNRNRRHDTFVTITMPELYSVNFSGASDSRISGFDNIDDFDIYLSGASVCQMDIEASRVETVISGASYLNIRGTGEILTADLSGTSVLKAFNFPVTRADLDLSGASDGNVTVMNQLDVIARGASHILYRGEPTVTSDLTGASSVHPD